MGFMNSMKSTLNEDFNESYTENGALGYRTTGKHLLDLNFKVASLRNLCKCSDSCYFEVSNGKYFVVNYYQSKIIFDINGINHIYKYDGRITNYGIHYDVATDKWLVVLENETGSFLTLVFKGNDIQYECNEIKYECSLGNMCMSNNTIFFPIDGKIRGFAYAKDMFKDFQCGVVNYDSKLIKSGKKFIIVNDENIYALS